MIFLVIAFGLLCTSCIACVLHVGDIVLIFSNLWPPDLLFCPLFQSAKGNTLDWVSCASFLLNSHWKMTVYLSLQCQK